jgi:hypothetical protein
LPSALSQAQTVGLAVTGIDSYPKVLKKQRATFWVSLSLAWARIRATLNLPPLTENERLKQLYDLRAQQDIPATLKNALG